jgi:subtilisin family serine protease
MKSNWLWVALIVSGCGAHVAATPRLATSAQANAVPGQWLVRLKPGAKPTGLKVLASLGLDMYRVSELPKGGVLWAEPEKKLALPKLEDAPAPASRAVRGGPNDPLLPAQYGREITGANQVWDVQRGSPDVVVAVIDSGIDASHPEFQGQLVPGWDVTVTPAVAGGTEDGYGHGTHVAGVIGAKADNGIGIAGVAPGCKLMPVRIFDKFGHSTEGASAAAVIWAVDHGAKVINASWGSPDPGQAAEAAYQYALSKDVVFVSAVGNSGKNDTQYFPGATPGVIGVAATTDIDTWGSFSTYGDWVDLAAPGEGILSTFPLAKGNGYRIMRGTSMACPLVTAAAALVRSQFPTWTQAQVKARLEATAKDVIQPGIDPYAGHGRVDITRALLDPTR